MSIYDKIKSPLEREGAIENLLDLYCSVFYESKGVNYYNLYKAIVNSQSSVINENEKKQYEDNFFKYIVEPAAEELNEAIKNNNFSDGNRADFFHLYTSNDMAQMFKEKTPKQIIEEGRKIEEQNPEIFDSLNSIFWNCGDIERRNLYLTYLNSNNIKFNEESLTNWMDYRALMEEFQTPDTMGFHHDIDMQDSCKMKFYINAGKDTYEFANLFNQKCREEGINAYYKVAIGNSMAEINRSDKMCIYIDDLQKIPQYLKILENIKKEKSEFQFEKPPITVGAIDEWIGVGADTIEASSYNKIISRVLEMFYSNNQYGIEKKVSWLMNNKNELLDKGQKEDIIKHISRNKTTIGQIAKNYYGLSAEKICIREQDAEILKNMDIISDKKAKDTREEPDLKESSKDSQVEPLSIDSFEEMYKNNFNGEISNPEISFAYKMFCDSKAKDEKIEMLEKKITDQDKLIKYDEIAVDELKNRINILHRIIKKAKDSFEDLETEMYNSGRKILDITKKINKEEKQNVFSKVGKWIKNIFLPQKTLPSVKNLEQISEDNIKIASELNKSTSEIVGYDIRRNESYIKYITDKRDSIKNGENPDSKSNKKEKNLFDNELSIDDQ